MTILYFILILGITITIHEFGHFYCAKKTGVYIYEFSIGMGPVIFKKIKNETTYSLRLFPIGGYVSMAGETVDNDQNIPDDRKLSNKKWSQRFIVMVAGVIMNFILAIVIFTIVGLINGVPTNNVYIDKIDSSITSNNLKPGDHIIKINDKKIKNIDFLMLDIQILSGENITLETKNKKILLKPKEIIKDDKISYTYGFSVKTGKEYGIIESIKYGFTKTYNIIIQMFYTLYYLVIGKLSIDNLAGPVGIFNLVNETAKYGFLNIIYLMAFFSVNVGVLNILPLPAFDGGRILFLIIEKIKGSKVNPDVENMIHFIGMSLILLFMVFITCKDVATLLT